MSTTDNSGSSSTADSASSADIALTQRDRRRRTMIVVGAVAVQLVLGSIYAWSVFGKALQQPEAMGLSKTGASWPFELAIGMIFVGTIVGGRLMSTFGPRVVAVAGVVLYAGGAMLSSLATTPDTLWALYLGYGVIGGFGLGLGYIVPIGLLQEWFPGKAAVVTGLAVAGFGFGAVLTAPVAASLMDSRPDHPTFALLVLGVIYLVLGVAGAATFRPAPHGTSENKQTDKINVFKQPAWWLLTGTLLVSVTAGISLVSMAASVLSDVGGLSAVAAASAVGALGVANAAGRLAWAAVASRAGRTATLMVLMALQGVALIALPHATSAPLLLVLAVIVFLCYGGAFGVMPTAIGDVFGARNAGKVYGMTLFGWSAGGVIGPLLASSVIGSSGYVVGFTVMGVLGLAGAVLPYAAARVADTSST